MTRVRGGEFVSITIEPTVEAPGIARRFAADTVGETLSVEDRETVLLLVSEVVSNAVMHVGGWMHVAVTTTSAGVRVEVSDSGGGIVSPLTVGLEDFALRLLDALSTRWGTEHRGLGKTVWFELSTT